MEEILIIYWIIYWIFIMKCLRGDVFLYAKLFEKVVGGLVVVTVITADL